MLGRSLMLDKGRGRARVRCGEILCEARVVESLDLEAARELDLLWD